jgi:hypothetical protein
VLSEQAVTIYSDLLDLVQLPAQRRQGLRSRRGRRARQARGGAQRVERARGIVRRSAPRAGGADRALSRAEIEVAAVYPALPPLAGAGFRPRCSSAARSPRGGARGARSVSQGRSAQLALLPDFSISLAGGRLGDQVLSLLRLNPWLVSVGIGVSIPIYEGGALRAKIQIATAQQAQAIASYGATALAAFREVENSLANERLLALQLPSTRSRSRTAPSRAHRNHPVQGGPQGSSWVAQLQTAQLASESNVIKLRGAQRTNRVRLYQALGGSFDAAPPTVISSR